MHRALEKPLPLRPGMRLKQPEFHRLYEECPPGVKFELLEGVVYMASPLRIRHGGHSFDLATLLGLYKFATPGVQGLENTTCILDEANEPQPDLALRLPRSLGGLSEANADDYLEGPPELVAEVSHASEKVDLERKRPIYERAGVSEYLLVLLKRGEVRWFDFASGDVIPVNRQGVAKSRVFPGLWLCPEALLAQDDPKALAVLNRGLASREHRAFVQRLAKAAAGGSA